jgi:ADP-ribose pyrophosphatase YjhB (NUDIX family)
MTSERFNPRFAVFLIFRQGNQILLLRRFNTGHNDGNYSLVSGHVDEGESFIQAAIREADEEAGVKISAEDLSLAYVLHSRHSDDAVVYINLYMNVGKWEGEIFNAEPEKCDDLSWFDMENLPENTIDYVRFTLEEVEEGRNFGQFGFEF